MEIGQCTTSAPSQTLILPASAPAASDPASVEPTLSLAAPTEPAIVASDSSDPGNGSQAVPEFARAPELSADLAAPVVSAPADAPLLPDYRIVTFYGHPHDPGMGIVGERGSRS